MQPGVGPRIECGVTHCGHTALREDGSVIPHHGCGIQEYPGGTVYKKEYSRERDLSAPAVQHFLKKGRDLLLDAGHRAFDLPVVPRAGAPGLVEQGSALDIDHLLEAEQLLGHAATVRAEEACHVQVVRPAAALDGEGFALQRIGPLAQGGSQCIAAGLQQSGHAAVAAEPHRQHYRTGGIAQHGPHCRKRRRLAGLYPLDHQRGRGAAPGNEILIDRPVVAREIAPQQRMIERTGADSGEPLGGNGLLCRHGGEKSGGIVVADIAEPLVGTARHRVVGAQQIAIGSVGHVVAGHLVVVHLEIGGSPLGIDGPEIGLHPDGPGPLVEQAGEVVDRAAHGQGPLHHHPFAVGQRRGVVLEVIRGGVHHGKPYAVVAGPHLAGQRVGAVDHPHERELALDGIEAHDTVVEVGGIAMLPQQRTSVGGHPPRNDCRGTGPGRHPGHHTQENEEKQPSTHGFDFLQT